MRSVEEESERNQPVEPENNNLGGGGEDRVDDSPPQTKYVTADEVRPEIIHTLYGGRFARSKMNLVQGDGGHGKGLILAHACADLSNQGEQIVWCSAEDGSEDTIVPRLMAARANLSNIIVPPIGSLQSILSEHLEPFMDDMRELLPKPTVLIFDSLKDYLLGVNTNRDGDIRIVLTYLAKYLADHDICGIGINHFNKNEELGAKNRGLGSVALPNHCRVVWTVALDPDEDCSCLAMTKNNLGTSPPGAKYRLHTRKTAKFDKQTGEIVMAEQEYVLMDNTQYRESGDSLLSRLRWVKQKKSKPPSNRERAIDFLDDLIPEGTQMDAAEALSRCEAEGYKTDAMVSARRGLYIDVRDERDPSGRFLRHIWFRRQIHKQQGKSLKERSTISGGKAPLDQIRSPRGASGNPTSNGPTDSPSKARKKKPRKPRKPKSKASRKKSPTPTPAASLEDRR